MGRIGQRVVREVLAPEFSVQVSVPDLARLPEAVRAQVEAIAGSMDAADKISVNRSEQHFPYVVSMS
jgi:hypothetical protein